MRKRGTPKEAASDQAALEKEVSAGTFSKERHEEAVAKVRYLKAVWRDVLFVTTSLRAWSAGLTFRANECAARARRSRWSWGSNLAENCRKTEPEISSQIAFRIPGKSRSRRTPGTFKRTPGTFKRTPGTFKRTPGSF